MDGDDMNEFKKEEIMNMMERIQTITDNSKKIELYAKNKQKIIDHSEYYEELDDLFLKNEMAIATMPQIPIELNTDDDFVSLYESLKDKDYISGKQELANYGFYTNFGCTKGHYSQGEEYYYSINKECDDKFVYFVDTDFEEGKCYWGVQLSDGTELKK